MKQVTKALQGELARNIKSMVALDTTKAEYNVLLCNIKTLSEVYINLQKSSDEKEQPKATKEVELKKNADPAPHIEEAQSEPGVKEGPAKTEEVLTLTMTDVRKTLAKASQAGHDVTELLRKHGHDKLSAIPPSEYAALYAEAKELVGAD